MWGRFTPQGPLTIKLGNVVPIDPLGRSALAQSQPFIFSAWFLRPVHTSGHHQQATVKVMSQARKQGDYLFTE